MKSNEGTEPWVAMPSHKTGRTQGGEQQYKTTAWIEDPHRKKAFENFVLKNYHDALEQERAKSAAS
jgi:hypothetical protein